MSDVAKVAPAITKSPGPAATAAVNNVAHVAPPAVTNAASVAQATRIGRNSVPVAPTIAKAAVAPVAASPTRPSPPLASRTRNLGRALPAVIRTVGPTLAPTTRTVGQAEHAVTPITRSVGQALAPTTRSVGQTLTPVTRTVDRALASVSRNLGQAMTTLGPITQTLDSVTEGLVPTGIRDAGSSVLAIGQTSPLAAAFGRSPNAPTPILATAPTSVLTPLPVAATGVGSFGDRVLPAGLWSPSVPAPLSTQIRVGNGRSNTILLGGAAGTAAALASGGRSANVPLQPLPSLPVGAGFANGAMSSSVSPFFFGFAALLAAILALSAPRSMGRLRLLRQLGPPKPFVLLLDRPG